ncbi:MAG: cytochrome c, partial [Weeksellaceae bacterium]|nr:cytochrome c [Weeksellaceae bacterium]
AFMKYTSMINTAGWPPEIYAKDAVIDYNKNLLEEKSGLPVKHAPVAGTATDGNESATPSGGQIAKDMGCMACHSTDGSVQIGPSWKSLYNTSVNLADGSSVTADDEYLKSSILKPNDQIVEGFQPGLMPSYEGVISEKDIDAIVEYIKTIN